MTDDDRVTCSNENEGVNVFAQNECHTYLATCNNTEGTYIVNVLLVTEVMVLIVPAVKISMNVLQATTHVMLMQLAKIILVHLPVNVMLAGHTLIMPPNLDLKALISINALRKVAVVISMPHVLIQIAHTPAHVTMITRIVQVVLITRTTASISMSVSEKPMNMHVPITTNDQTTIMMIGQEETHKCDVNSIC